MLNAKEENMTGSMDKSSRDNTTQSEDNNQVNTEITERLSQNGAVQMFSLKAGLGVVRVIGRCEDAKENNNLDLSECQLIQVPDAIFHIMRHTEIKICDLSCNDITKLPSKFALQFNLITELNISHNQMGKLPDELSDLEKLEVLDMSFNSFIALPAVVFRISKLRHLKANDNQIIDIDTDELTECGQLQVVELQSNPLTLDCYDALRKLRVPFTITL